MVRLIRGGLDNLYHCCSHGGHSGPYMGDPILQTDICKQSIQYRPLALSSWEGSKH